MEIDLGLILLQIWFWSLFVIVVFFTFKMFLEGPLMALLGKIINLLWKLKKK